MERMIKYLPELSPEKLKRNIERAWKIYIKPPKERRVFLSPDKLETITRLVDKTHTREQPKQVVYDPTTQRALVSCMRGHALQVFRVGETGISLERNIEFPDQCVEVLVSNGLIFATTTNFERPPRNLQNKLWIINASSLETISSIDTGGNWSKLIAIRPQADELLISNWHSHDISVIDIKDPQRPRIKQVLQWGEAPRGIEFFPGGKGALVTGFYSGNIGELKRDDKEKWEIVFVSERFDHPHYSGNMRHVLVNPDGETAVISNLGRNLIHFWNIRDRKITNSLSVGKSPNSMAFLNDKLVAVSCRDSSFVYIVEQTSQKVLGKSQKTEREPTGLCAVGGGFLVTCFKDHTLEFHMPRGSTAR